MATGFDFTLTRNAIISKALRKLGVIPENGTPTTTQYSEHADDLNMLLKLWQTRGYDFWTDKEIYILPQNNADPYNRGFQVNVSADNSVATATNTYHVVTSYIYTTTTLGSISGSGTLTLTSVANLSPGMMIGVEITSGLIHWTTISTVGINIVNLTVPLPSAVAEQASVWAYNVANRAEQPISLFDDVWHFNAITSYKTPVNVVAYNEQRKLPETGNSGIVNQITFMRNWVSSKIGTFFLWPGFHNASGMLIARVKYKVPIFTADDAGQQYPDEMYDVLVYNLAAKLAPNYGLPSEVRLMLKEEAKTLLQELEDNSNEAGMTSTYFTPERH